MRLLVLILLMSFSLFASSPSERYIVTIKISQSHMTLNLWQHIKDDANAITIEIPVDKQFYNDVSVGKVLNNKFRTA